MNLTLLYPLLRPLLFKMDAETAHRITIKALKLQSGLSAPTDDDPVLRTTLWNRNFSNPLGLAAGFDKNAEAIGPMMGFGFGFIEAGTVTPRPQHGNPRPRVFRAIDDAAVINRMGFPNVGMNKFKTNLEKFLDARPRQNGLVGINIGMNKSQTDAAKDYCLLIRTLGPLADYMTINISSPNTPGLRNLQEPEAFLDLMGQILEERNRSCDKHMPPPILVKLAPDLSEAQQEALAAAALSSGIDGLILTNTTLDRPENLPENFRAEKGGLSGRPLTQKSTAIIRNFYKLTSGKLPIIGAGGVSSATDAYDKIRAGASLVQIYSALVFQGPGMVKQIIDGLTHLLKTDGFSHIKDAVGADHH